MFQKLYALLEPGTLFGQRCKNEKGKDKREKVEKRVNPKSRISIDVTFPKEIVHIPPWDATAAVTAWR